MELLKTQNSRLATKIKAEFTVVNEHFVEGAKHRSLGFSSIPKIKKTCQVCYNLTGLESVIGEKEFESLLQVIRPHLSNEHCSGQ